MAQQEYDWLVQIPDKKSPGIFELRRENLPAHVSHNSNHVQAGHVVMSGPVLAAQPRQHGDPIDPIGSVMVWRAETETQVRGCLKEDPYASLGVWDLEKATVTPFLCAVRKQL